MISDANSAIDYIHSLHRFGKKSGLSNITTMLERLGNPQKALHFVHIAGTNGKGSVSNLLKHILINHGYKVGYYTSPYIEYFSERICIGNNMISDDDLVYYTKLVKEVTKDINPIEFEFITAMAMCYFKDKCCDIVVLEVGLGGRFDATNIIDTPLLNVITSIGLDHTEILGDTTEKIAFEKAGTIKTGSEVVVGQGIDKKAIEVIEDRCRQMCANLVMPSVSVSNIEYMSDYTRFTYGNENYLLSLKGTYQVQNAVTAIESARALSKKIELFEDDIKAGLKSAMWKCRFEVFEKDVTIVLDGAHNSHGIKALMESIEAYYPTGERVFLFSMLGEKDWKQSIDHISVHTSKIVLTRVPSQRITKLEDMYDYIKSKSIECIIEDDFEKAFYLSKNLAAKSGGALFVFGSLYLSGAIRTIIEN